jgi:hypothetical protein
MIYVLCTYLVGSVRLDDLIKVHGSIHGSIHVHGSGFGSVLGYALIRRSRETIVRCTALSAGGAVKVMDTSRLSSDYTNEFAEWLLVLRLRITTGRTLASGRVMASTYRFKNM